jgi:hypothetical protein
VLVQIPPAPPKPSNFRASILQKLFSLLKEGAIDLIEDLID